MKETYEALRPSKSNKIGSNVSASNNLRVLQDFKT